MQRKLIVNADDLGLSEKTNEGIFTAHLKGIVSSTTLMVTMPAVEHALAGSQGMDLDIGLHIDLTWGKPLSPAAGISTLVDGNGRFNGKRALMKQLLLNRIKRLDLENEISAQVQAFKRTGLDLVHVDVHQHFHGFPQVMKALMSVAVREEIPYIRFVNEATWSKPVYTLIYAMFLFSKRFISPTIRRADHFSGLALTDNVTESALIEQLQRLQPGLTELMCHPGYDDPDLSGLSRLQSREAEIEALTSERVKDTIVSKEIMLTTYRDEFKSLLIVR